MGETGEVVEIKYHSNNVMFSVIGSFSTSVHDDNNRLKRALCAVGWLSPAEAEIMRSLFQDPFE